MLTLTGCLLPWKKPISTRAPQLAVPLLSVWRARQQSAKESGGKLLGLLPRLGSVPTSCAVPWPPTASEQIWGA